MPDPLDLLPQRAVALPGDVRDVLEELAVGDAAGEVALREVVVVAAFLLAFAAEARCRGDRKLELGHARQQLADQRSLAGARRPGDDQHRRRRARSSAATPQPQEASGAGGSIC